MLACASRLNRSQIHDASRSEKLCASFNCPHAYHGGIQAHGSIDRFMQESHAARRLGSCLNLLPPGGGIFASRRVTALAVCRSAFVTQASAAPLRWLATRSFRPPSSLRLFTRRCLASS